MRKLFIGTDLLKRRLLSRLSLAIQNIPPFDTPLPMFFNNMQCISVWDRGTQFHAVELQESSAPLDRPRMK